MILIWQSHIQMECQKRFYAACAAMQGLMANKDSDKYSLGSNVVTDSLDNKVKFAYMCADELLRQENL